jgi:hypothetical protein
MIKFVPQPPMMNQQMYNPSHMQPYPPPMFHRPPTTFPVNAIETNTAPSTTSPTNTHESQDAFLFLGHSPRCTRLQLGRKRDPMKMSSWTTNSPLNWMTSLPPPQLPSDQPDCHRTCNNGPHGSINNRSATSPTRTR